MIMCYCHVNNNKLTQQIFRTLLHEAVGLIINVRFLLLHFEEKRRLEFRIYTGNI